MKQFMKMQGKVVPDQVLSSLGIGNKLMEISGSVVSRKTTDRLYPGDALCSCWLSLDRNSDWFGASQKRADMVRLDFKVSPKSISMKVIVVESKFGRNINSAGAENQRGYNAFFESAKFPQV